MSEGQARAGDSYIAARRGDLIEALTESGLSAEEAARFPIICRLLAALFQHEAGERLDALKALYDAVDPDAPDVRRDPSRAAFDAFERAAEAELGRANFVEIEADTVKTRDATKVLTDLSIKPSFAGIRKVRFFGRGARPERLTVKRWFGLRTVDIDAEVLSDVIVLVGFKSEDEIQRRDRSAFARMRRGVRPGAALIKHFHNIAAPELVTLHPGARPSMRTRDQLFLAAPALAGGVPVLLNIIPALTVLGAVATATFAAHQMLDNDRLTHAIGALGGLIALGAFVLQQRLKYEATALRYHKRLADTVYFRNLANNTGVFSLLVGATVEQDAKEAFLAYWALLRTGKPMTRQEIDHAAEALLRERFELAIDFEIHDALSKLERLGLVTLSGEAYSVAAPEEALKRLDLAWDNVFKFD